MCFAQLETDRFPKDFKDRISGDDGDISDFWSGAVAAEDPRLRGNSLCDVAGWEEHAIPLRIHGDGVPYTKSKSLEVLSISSKLGHGHSLDSLFMVSCAVKVYRFLFSWMFHKQWAFHFVETL